LNPHPHLQAELAKLKAETELLEAQNRKTRAELNAQMYLLMAQTGAETSKIIRESRWYPFVIGAGSIGVGIAAVLVLAKLLKL
jgi:hypothetical protein